MKTLLKPLILLMTSLTLISCSENDSKDSINLDGYWIEDSYFSQYKDILKISGKDIQRTNPKEVYEEDSDLDMTTYSKLNELNSFVMHFPEEKNSKDHVEFKTIDKNTLALTIFEKDKNGIVDRVDYERIYFRRISLEEIQNRYSAQYLSKKELAVNDPTTEELLDMEERSQKRIDLFQTFEAKKVYKRISYTFVNKGVTTEANNSTQTYIVPAIASPNGKSILVKTINSIESSNSLSLEDTLNGELFKPDDYALFLDVKINGLDNYYLSIKLPSSNGLSEFKSDDFHPYRLNDLKNRSLNYVSNESGSVFLEAQINKCGFRLIENQRIEMECISRFNKNARSISVFE